MGSWAKIIRETYRAQLNRYRFRRFIDRYKRQRMAQIELDLSLDDGADAVMFGDSHVEMTAPHLPSGWAINAGIFGATARLHARLLARTNIRRKIRVSILMVGTNDIAKTRALARRHISSFRDDVETVLRKLKRHSETVMVAALPPAHESNTSLRTCAFVEAYTDELKALCVTQDCAFFDPFAFMRGDRFGLAVPDAFADGLHLADYSVLAVQMKMATEAVLERPRSGQPDLPASHEEPAPAEAPRV